MTSRECSERRRHQVVADATEEEKASERKRRREGKRKRKRDAKVRCIMPWNGRKKERANIPGASQSRAGLQLPLQSETERRNAPGPFACKLATAVDRSISPSLVREDNAFVLVSVSRSSTGKLMKLGLRFPTVNRDGRFVAPGRQSSARELRDSPTRCPGGGLTRRAAIIPDFKADASPFRTSSREKPRRFLWFIQYSVFIPQAFTVMRVIYIVGTKACFFADSVCRAVRGFCLFDVNSR